LADSRKAPFHFWRFFFSLQGRVSRGPFLAFELITRLGLLAGYQGLRYIPGLAPVTIGLYSLPLALISLIVLWPNFALLFKRFHDAGQTGLWALPYFAPFFYGVYIGFSTLQAGFHKHALAASPPYVTWALIAINYGLILVAALLPGTRTANRFGPRPGHLPAPVQDVF
jgi:uncharacterized membrane protein YhaH (DUF805 family)